MNGPKSWMIPIFDDSIQCGIPCYYVRRKEKQQLIDYITHKTYYHDRITAVYEISTLDFKTRDLKDVAKYGKLVYKKEVSND